MIHGIAEALFLSIGAVAGRTIVYRRGSASLVLSAIPGVTAFQTVDQSQLVEETRSRDFLVLASDLQLSGNIFTPDRGDVIEEVFPGRTESYEIMAPADGTPPYRYSDAAKTILRIHTKQVS